ncbi:MAG: methionine--tRNA ligase, partial [candidate division Zixibacteria bacterium]|nr:methionine--tRNA ligase [candidate division Zixibacteria bacterium]
MSFYITTPIYYANAEPHIGHGYTTVTADIVARFHQLVGEETFFLTGLDEHGSKIEEAAIAAGKTPQELVDENSERFRRTFAALDICYDDFIRTTSERHKKGVRKFLGRLWESRTPAGEPVIYQGEYEGLYCTGCENFITEKELTDDGLCPAHLTKPKKLSEANYFFRLSAYLGQVEELIRSGKMKIMPDGRRNEVLALLKQGLDDFSISRERVGWGIELPFDSSQKTYVWVDALQNYITAIGYGDDRENFDKRWRNSQIVHLMAKDILKFHAIYWPAMLLAAGEKTPEVLFIHGYISLDGQKISKSLGNAIANERLINDFGRDAARYLLVSQFPFHQDGDINYARLYEKYNSDLANDYGNLVSRVIKMVFVNFEGRIPPVGESGTIADDELGELLVSVPQTVIARIGEIDVMGAIESTWSLIRGANRFFDHNKPWELAKKGETEKLGPVLYRSLDAVRVVASLTAPIMPDKSRQVFRMLGLPDDYQPSLADVTDRGFLKSGTQLVKGENIFPRLKVPQKEAPATTDESRTKDVAGV